MEPGRPAPRLETQRLVLRETRAEDFDASARLWADERVVRHIGGRTSDRSQSWLRMLRYPGLWALLGFGYWTLETRAGAFVGEVGLADFKRELSVDTAGMPEAGWVLNPDHQGRGYATEAMTAVLAWADQQLSAAQTCCVIEPDNKASIRVAAKLGYGSPVTVQLGEQALQLFRRPRGG